jgi:hypothetical protein
MHMKNNMKTQVLFTVTLLFAFNSYAQQIATDPSGLLTSQNFCAGFANFTVEYTSSGCTFTSTNDFNVELSDQNGNNYSVIYTLTGSSASSGTITCSLSSAALEGTGYKVRISSTQCAATLNTSQQFSIHEIPSSITITSPDIPNTNFVACFNTTPSLVATPTFPSVTGTPGYLWSTSSTTSNSNPITPPGTYTVTVSNPNYSTCSSTAPQAVTVNPQLNANTGASLYTFNPNSSSTTITASANGGTPAYSFLWAPSSQLTSSNTATPDVIFNTVDIPTVFTVTVTDNQLCTATASTTVETIKLILDVTTLNTGPTFDLTAGSINLTALSSGMPNSKYYFGPTGTGGTVLIHVNAGTGIQPIDVKYDYDANWNIVPNTIKADLNASTNFLPLSSDYYLISTSNPRELKLRLTKPDAQSASITAINLINRVEFDETSGNDFKVDISSLSPCTSFTSETLTITKLTPIPNFNQSFTTFSNPCELDWDYSTYTPPSPVQGVYKYTVTLVDGAGTYQFEGQFIID